MRLLLPALLSALHLSSCASTLSPTGDPGSDARLERASRRDQDGWIFLHLEGSPGTIGYQYGWLAAAEILLAEGGRVVVGEESKRAFAVIDVEIAARQELEQLIPRPLHRPRADTELFCQRRGKVDFEADQVEVLSLSGEITRNEDGSPHVHGHVVVGLRDGRAFGGHLLKGVVKPIAIVNLYELTHVPKPHH